MEASVSSKAKRKQRRREYRLERELDEKTPFYLRVSLTEFKNSGTSSVERIAAIRNGLKQTTTRP